jgi:hypothetical protein
LVTTLKKSRKDNEDFHALESSMKYSDRNYIEDQIVGIYNTHWEMKIAHKILAGNLKEGDLGTVGADEKILLKLMLVKLTILHLNGPG